MKINRVRMNCHQPLLTDDNTREDAALYFFKTPVIFGSGNSEVCISGRSAIVFRSGYRRSFRSADGKELRYDYIAFRPSSSDKQYIGSLGLPEDTPIELNDDIAITAMFHSIESRMHKSRRSSEFIELSMKLMFIILSEEKDFTVPEAQETIPHYFELKTLRESIFADPMNPWTIEEICREFDMSHTYFHRLYLKAFGVTCRQDVIESRLLYAAELLKSTELSVSEIAEQCGYDSDSYFMRQFKKHKGCTPTEYRRRNR